MSVTAYVPEARWGILRICKICSLCGSPLVFKFVSAWKCMRTPWLKVFQRNVQWPQTLKAVSIKFTEHKTNTGTFVEALEYIHI